MSRFPSRRASGALRVGIDNVSPGESTALDGPGGMRMYLLELMAHLPTCDAAAEFRVLTPAWNADFGALDTRVTLARLARVPRSRARRTLYQQVELVRAIRRESLDVWLAIATVSPLRLEVPVVLVVQFLQFYEFPGAYGRARTAYLKWILPRAVVRAKRVIVFTEFQRRELLERVPGCEPHRVAVIPHGLHHEALAVPASPDELLTIATLTRGRPYVFYASATYGYKNHLGLVDAFALLKRRRPDLPHCLLLAGSEQAVSFDSLRRRASELGILDDVVVAGRLSSVAAAYQAADVFAFASLYETFGFPGLEAMAAGCPVVATGRGAIAELLGSAAVLTDTTNPEAFADALERVLSDAALRTALAVQGRARAAQYTWARTAAATFRVLLEAAADR